ncbi:hypothetical protein [Agromyces binzhouensis]|uniref:hypothetical protein n=1 Tax=Agromyces binzhouensis TaxID=1817495 RepID=UPI0036435FD5
MATFWTVALDIALLFGAFVIVAFGQAGFGKRRDLCDPLLGCGADDFAIASGSNVMFLGVIALFLVAVYLGIRLLKTRRGKPYYMVAVIPLAAFAAMFVPLFGGLAIAGWV